MVLDLFFSIIIILAIIRGYQRGLVVGVFSFLAIIIGLAAAIKLSAVVAGYIGKAVKVSDEWLPVISFALVFLLIVLLVRWIANMIQGALQATSLGWINRIGGIAFYIALCVVVLSIIIFYADQIHLIRDESRNKSVIYPYIQPWGPKVINAFGSVIPFFKNMFIELENFFGHVSDKLSQSYTSL